MTDLPTNEIAAISEAPSDIVASAARNKVLVTDARGRVIAVHKLNALQYYRLAKAMGGDTASNPAAMDLAVIASSVRRIDTLDLAVPATERDVEFLMQQLDFDGLAAAGRRPEATRQPQERRWDRSRKKLSQRPAFKLRVAACGGTMSFDIAFSADDDFVLAWIVAKGENEGATFDWVNMQWIDRK
jgi:hypothetical protein